MKKALRLIAALSWLIPFSAGAASNCAVPDDLLPETVALPNMVGALKAGRPLTIVALGTAATAGTGLQSSDMAFPARFAEKLKERYKGIAVRLVNRGRMGQSTRAMADAVTSKVLPDNPNLVLWEAGAVEAVNGSDPYRMADDLRRGLEALQAAHVDVILIDMQYATAAAALINFTPYLDAVHVSGEQFNVPILRRFAAMRVWTEAGEIDLDGTPIEQRSVQAARTGNCVADALAEIVDRAYRHPPGTQP